MAVQKSYQFLEPRPGPNYRQLFFNGRKLRVEILYRAAVEAEPRTPEAMSDDYDVPLEEAPEAIYYCIHNEPLLRQECEAVMANIRARGLDKPPFVPTDTSTVL